MDFKKNLVIINILLFNFCIIASIKPEKVTTPVVPHVKEIIVPPEPVKPIDTNYTISDPVPEYLDYKPLVAQLKKWHDEAPEITEIGTYGKSSRNEDLYYFRINVDDVEKPKVLITACIHGNEPWSTTSVMGYIGTLLDKFGEDETLTQMMKSRDVYFIPVVSPDSYPTSRIVDRVDPNRNFPTRDNPGFRSVPPVEALKSFFLKIKPNAVISGHTWGRVYLTPWGDINQTCPNDTDYQRIIGKMCELSDYKMMRASQMYNQPIFGTEVDWYYRNKSFSIVMEFGTHQRIPTYKEIESEFNRTFGAVLYFIQEAPNVKID